jgi:hypothetical protein
MKEQREIPTTSRSLLERIELVQVLMEREFLG